MQQICLLTHMLHLLSQQNDKQQQFILYYHFQQIVLENGDVVVNIMT